MTPKIVQVNKIARMAVNGLAYMQDYAVMDDGSQWEVPCVGNGNIWRKVYLSTVELQESFNNFYLASLPKESNNELNGNQLSTKGNADNHSTSTGRSPRSKEK